MKWFPALVLLNFVILFSSCNKTSCSAKNTQVDTYDFNDSLYSPILLEWIPQSYELTVSYCTKSPESLRFKFLNTVSHDISADRNEEDNTFTIPMQELDLESWKEVSGDGWFTESAVYVNYTMKNFDLEEFQGAGVGILK